MDPQGKKMKIDAEKFAYAVISSQNVESDLSEEIAKNKLTIFLTSYWLAERFNQLEAQSFENMERKDYEDLLLKLSRFRSFR